MSEAYSFALFRCRVLEEEHSDEEVKEEEASNENEYNEED